MTLQRAEAFKGHIVAESDHPAAESSDVEVAVFFTVHST
jgi:hypothetical protein